MSVCDIKAVQFTEPSADILIPFFLFYFPDTMPDSVITHEIIYRHPGNCTVYLFSDSFIGPVSQENGPRMCTADIHVPDPVHFFVFSGILMFFYHLIQIIIYGCTAHQPSLTPAIHGKLIKIKTGILILNKLPLCLHFPKRITGSFVYLIRIHIRPLRKLRLRTVYFQKRQRMFLHDSSRLFAAVYIIRECCDFSGKLRRRTDSSERSDLCHVLHPLLSHLINLCPVYSLCSYFAIEIISVSTPHRNLLHLP